MPSPPCRLIPLPRTCSQRAQRPFHALFPAAAVASLHPAGEVSLAKLGGVLRSARFGEWAAPRLRSLLAGLAGCAFGAGLTVFAVAVPELSHFARPFAEACGVAGAALFVPRLLLCVFEVAREEEGARPMGADATLVGAALHLFTALWLACRGGVYKGMHEGAGDVVVAGLELGASMLLVYIGASSIALLERHQVARHCI